MKIVDNVSALNKMSIKDDAIRSKMLALVDKLNVVENLLRISVFAASSFEDTEQRDAFVALSACMEEKIADCISDLRSSFNER